MARINPLAYFSFSIIERVKFLYLVSLKYYIFNRKEHIGHQCRKTTVLSCHGYLIKTGVEKMNYIEI
jgi:hypothetical protein